MIRWAAGFSGLTGRTLVALAVLAVAALNALSPRSALARDNEAPRALLSYAIGNCSMTGIDQQLMLARKARTDDTTAFNQRIELDRALKQLRAQLLQYYRPETIDKAGSIGRQAAAERRPQDQTAPCSPRGFPVTHQRTIQALGQGALIPPRDAADAPPIGTTGFAPNAPASLTKQDTPGITTKSRSP